MRTGRSGAAPVEDTVQGRLRAEAVKKCLLKRCWWDLRSLECLLDVRWS